MAQIDERRSPAGALTYRARVRLRGHPEASATFTRKTDAKRWVQDTESAIREGRYFALAEARRHTLGELVDRYIAEVLSRKPKNAANTKRNLLWWKARIGAYALADVGAQLIVQQKNVLLDTKTRRGTYMSPSTVVRYLAALSHALTIAVKDWAWLDDSPMRKVSKPKQPRGRERLLSDDERDRLLTACKASTSNFLHAVVVLAISTGSRVLIDEQAFFAWVDSQRGATE